MYLAKKATFALVVSAVVALGAASAAWACVPGGGGGGGGNKLTIEPKVVSPGDDVTVIVPSSTTSTPIEVRLHGSDGPLLGTLIPRPGASSSASFRVPIGTRPGEIAVIAVQQGAKWEPVAIGVAGPDGIVPSTARAASPGARTTGGVGRSGLLVGAVGIGIATLAAGPVLRARRRRMTSTGSVAS